VGESRKYGTEKQRHPTDDGIHRPGAQRPPWAKRLSGSAVLRQSRQIRGSRHDGYDDDSPEESPTKDGRAENEGRYQIYKTHPARGMIQIIFRGGKAIWT
jgi:hypothetical protein